MTVMIGKVHPARERGNSLVGPLAISIFSALIAALSCFFAWQSVRNTEKVVKINSYIALREKYDKVIHEVPGIYFTDQAKAPPKGSVDRRKIQDYWYLSFDEWYLATRVGDSRLRELWDDRYRFLIAEQLKKEAFREVVCDMMREKFSLNELQRDFSDELMNIHRTSMNRELCT